jgi:nucleoside 2-deoxyribosyltransferase
MDTQQKEPVKVYLACPYSHPTCKEWERVRFDLANIAAMTLINAGYIVFSPISHSHPVSSTQPAERNSYVLWLGQDVHFMEWADKCVVLTLPGWLDSHGVKWEIEWFTKNQKPIDYVSMETIYHLQKEQSRVKTNHA